MEGMLAAIFRASRNVEIPTPFRADDLSRGDRTISAATSRIAVSRMQLVDFSEDFRARARFKVFRGALDAGGVVKAINAKGFRQPDDRPDATS